MKKNRQDRGFKALLASVLCLTGFIPLGAQTFFVPHVPPRAQYTIEARLTAAPGFFVLEGTERISFKNTTPQPIYMIAVSWAADPSIPLTLSYRGRTLAPVNADKSYGPESALFYILPEAVLPGDQAEFRITFGNRYKSTDHSQIGLLGWHPRLWWENIPSRDAYKVKFSAPEGYAMAVSGRLKESGCYENDGVTTSFGLFLSKTMKTVEREVEGVLLKGLFTNEGEECARFCLESAADIIKFYKEWHGFFPFDFLTIIPGSPNRAMGGYPYASGIVSIHGQHVFKTEPPLHWTWITAHELGHQYWGEYMMSGDYPFSYIQSWLMIGMGICADREYIRSRRLGLDKHRGLMNRYLQGVRERKDTTADAPPSLLKKQKFDLNNIVIHGKGFSILSALEIVIGRDVFKRITMRCHREFVGKPLGYGAFQKLCEEESGQNLTWFFEQWVRSSQYLCYEVKSKQSVREGGKFISEIVVESAPFSILMPVPVKFLFEDGTNEIRTTDRLSEKTAFTLVSKTNLKEVILDPDQGLAMLEKPLAALPEELPERIVNLPWTGTGDRILSDFSAAREHHLDDPQLWYLLGLKLIGWEHLPEAFTSFEEGAKLHPSDKNIHANMLVWMGHLKDLEGRREEAVGFYKEALAVSPNPSMNHSQWDIVISRQWVEERLKVPFTWTKK